MTGSIVKPLLPSLNGQYCNSGAEFLLFLY